MTIPHIPKSIYRPMLAAQREEWRAFCAERVSCYFCQPVSECQLLAEMGRSGSYPRWRFYAMALMEAHGMSQPRIAAVLGLSDHTSVLHGLRRAHGHDGKLIRQHKPLWKREHFEKVALADQQEAEGRAWEEAA